MKPVKAREEPVVIPTYVTPAADKNPMFLDKRVYQGSSGKVYPNPFTDRVSDEKVDKTYTGVFLENEYVRLMILPEIGGRIHIGQDKTNGYDFFYRQTVIKPALVGLAGPWISGGVEFNWPQHHRPSTFMPVEHTIEEHQDGSRTVWLSEHEPMNRMKGMVGICLHPGKSLVEAKVRLYNRTPLVQTFLWWANVAVRVHDQYQSFFPPDVTYVADHAKRAVSSFPIARGLYYGVDYANGVDITWYKNIPVPTSYMVTNSAYDFFGGYDHAKKAGLVHVADRLIAPGKKQWTWGNAEFGYAWDRELSDSDGPYIELMGGAYTDNQPDFSFLQPYETKTFSQFWYPIQEIGPAKNANSQLAINLEPTTEGCRIGVCGTELQEDLTIVLTANEQVVVEHQVAVGPGRPFVEQLRLSRSFEASQLLLRVLDKQHRELIRYAPEAKPEKIPQPASEPPLPAEIKTNEELYLTGLHLDQYRHATRYPGPYWREALKRDPDDARCNNALGVSALRQGKFAEAECHFQAAVRRLIERNPNPYDGEPFYNLGLALKYQGRMEEAYEVFYKAAWNHAWQSASYYSLATIDCLRGKFAACLEHLDRSMRTDADNLKSRNLKTVVLRLLGRRDEARAVAKATMDLDRLDLYSQNEFALLTDADMSRIPGESVFRFFRGEAQTFLDVAFDYADAGLWAEAKELVARFIANSGEDGIHPMLWYAQAHFARRLNEPILAAQWYAKAREASPDYCFPSRLEEMVVLKAALKENPGDARAQYYLGNLLYDKHRRGEAMNHWEAASQLDPDFSTPFRNLGIAYFNVGKEPGRALESYERAFQANPADARLLYEFDQLRKRTGVPPERRLKELEQYRELVDRRDDLTVELVTLYNRIDRPAKALELLSRRRFHPWEGGEGLVSGQYVVAHLLLGRDALDSGDAAKALAHFRSARVYPQNLGEGKHLLMQETHLDYFSGVALSLLGRTDEAKSAWEAASVSNSHPSFFTFYHALALDRLGNQKAAVSALQALKAAAEKQMTAEVKIDYFATSLPNFLIFEDDLKMRNQVEALFLRALANLGLGIEEEAIAELQRVVTLDRNHLGAHTELKYLGTRTHGDTGRYH